MSKLTQYNKTENMDVNTTLPFTKLRDLDKSKIYPIRSMWINKGSKYGDEGIITTDDNNVNLPTHLTPTIKSILTDPEAVAEIKEGRAGFTIRSYEAYGKECYTINFVDM